MEKSLISFMYDIFKNFETITIGNFETIIIGKVLWKKIVQLTALPWSINNIRCIQLVEITLKYNCSCDYTKHTVI